MVAFVPDKRTLKGNCHQRPFSSPTYELIYIYVLSKLSKGFSACFLTFAKPDIFVVTLRPTVKSVKAVNLS